MTPTRKPPVYKTAVEFCPTCGIWLKTDDGTMDCFVCELANPALAIEPVQYEHLVRRCADAISASGCAAPPDAWDAAVIVLSEVGIKQPAPNAPAERFNDDTRDGTAE